MGGVISSIQSSITAITSVIRTISTLNAKYQALLQRIETGPFTPVENPTESYWMRDAPFPDIRDVLSEIPREADVVVVGSGITGAAAVKTLCELSSSSSTGDGDGIEKAPRVVVLEARQLCSGATARNGGHIKCTPHEEFSRLRKTLGEERARKVVRMQMRHLEVLKQVGEEMPWGEVREVETVDVFLEEDGFERARRGVDEMRGWMPEFEVFVWEGERMREKFGVNRHIVGAISYQAGALWPYRLVTSTWNDLMTRYPNLTISTHTPVSSISTNDSSSFPYTVHSSRGTIRARHILHATNAYTGHLVPALRGCLTGVLGHMTAQQPGAEFAPVCHGGRSWSIMYGTGFEYITQRPDGNDGSPGDLMIGGGLFRSKDEGLDQIGVWDDSRVDAFPLMHLRGSMPTVFEPKWGAGGQLKGAWSGIMGFTGDVLPFVGSLSPEVGGLRKSLGGGLEKGAGEWIAAGFNGEGMVWAWLSGVAVAIMMLGKEEDDLEESVGRPGRRLGEWYPVEEVRVDKARLRRARLENLANEI
ncbi:FAD dependent oxidoreductase domain-containing protein [Trichoderma afarasin]